MRVGAMLIAAISKTVLASARARGFRGVLDGLLVGAQRPAAVDQAAGLEGLGELERAREVVLVAVGALDLQLAQPGRGEVGLQLAGHADEHHAAARTGDRGGLFEARSAPHTVKYTVEAAKQHLAALMSDQSARMRDPRALDVDAIGRADVIGAEAARGGLLAGVLGDAISVALGAASRTAASVSRPIVPAPMIATLSPGWTSAIRAACSAQASGSTSTASSSPRSSGTRVQLRLVRDQALAPAAAGVAAEAGLQAGARRRRRSCCGTARAGPAAHSVHGGEAADGAAERGLDDDALAAPRPGPDLAHDLVAGDERRADVSVARCREALPESSARSEPQMPVSVGRTGSQSGPGRARRADLLAARARRRRAGPRLRGDVLRRASACRSAPASDRGPSRSSTSRSASGAGAPRGESRKSGLIGCGWPTSSSIGRSARLSP